MTSANYEQLPDGLPVPQDDGAAAHLPGLAMPSLTLTATTGPPVDVSALGHPRAVLYIYPRTGQPGVPLPDGWDEIPGARGCTPESMSFRDLHQEITGLGAEVFGLSSQDPAYQRELAGRLGLPYPLLADPGLELAAQLGLPTFTAGGEQLYKRLTLVLRDGRIEHVFYPIFPPGEHAADVLAWLREAP
jgi:peroxiredoxin